ncbi:MAG: hypothetical protein ABI230_08885 [Aestuariivirga sp.]
MQKKLVVELLDVMQFATPSIVNLDIERTAAKIVAYKKNGTRRSYNMAFEHLSLISAGHLKKEQFIALMNQHPDIEWRKFLKEVAALLFDQFAELGGVWYPSKRKPIEIFSTVWTKPAIRGVLVRDHVAHPLLVNPRASLSLHNDSYVAFAGRGVYELHVIDDPQAHGPAILDLGRHPATKQRHSQIHFLKEVDLMPLEQFEGILKRFLSAVRLAGFDVNPDAFYTVSDLFRSSPRRDKS